MLAQKQKPEVPQTIGPCQLLVSLPERGCCHLGTEPAKLWRGAGQEGLGQTRLLKAETPGVFCHP